TMTIPGLTIELEGALPVYRQIADGIRAALASGRLSAGQQLPPTRDLAKQLGVNRNTVIAAYELLVETGIATGQTGRGTFLVGPRGPSSKTTAMHDPSFGAFSRAVEGSKVGSLLTIYRVATAQEGISLAGGYPASDLMPIDAFTRSMKATLERRG